MPDQMIIRINPELKNKVRHLAKTEGKSVSVVVRELLESYVKERDITQYLDNLWERAGEKVKKKGVNEQDISLIINKVRKEKK
jgi:predicted DNA-binding protein